MRRRGLSVRTRSQALGIKAESDFKADPFSVILSGLDDATRPIGPFSVNGGQKVQHMADEKCRTLIEVIESDRVGRVNCFSTTVRIPDYSMSTTGGAYF
jgi:hypothetical protein